MPPVINPLLVVIKEAGAKARPCLNCRASGVNAGSPDEPFNYQDIHNAVQISTPNCYYYKLDIKDCFLTWKLHPSMFQYFAFQLSNILYNYKYLPFGYKLSPYANELLMAVISAYLTLLGIPHAHYVDDFILAGTSPEQVVQFAEITKNVFKLFGLVNNTSKEEGPAQNMDFIGFALDSKKMTLAVTQKRVNALNQFMTHTLHKSHASVKMLDFESFVGKLAFAGQGLPALRPFLHTCYAHIKRAGKGPNYKQAYIRVNNNLRNDVTAIQHILTSFNNHNKWPQCRSATFTIQGDACMTHYGFYIKQEDTIIQHTVTAGHFSEQDMPQTKPSKIQYGELFAVTHAFAKHHKMFQNKHVLILCDNMSDVYILNKHYSPSRDLIELLRVIDILATTNKITYEAKHIPGVENVIADTLSRPLLLKKQTSLPEYNVTHIRYTASSEAHRLIKENEITKALQITMH
jgi:hypothetical protein